MRRSPAFLTALRMKGETAAELDRVCASDAREGGAVLGRRQFRLSWTRAAPAATAPVPSTSRRPRRLWRRVPEYASPNMEIAPRPAGAEARTSWKRWASTSRCRSTCFAGASPMSASDFFLRSGFHQLDEARHAGANPVEDSHRIQHSWSSGESRAASFPGSRRVFRRDDGARGEGPAWVFGRNGLWLSTARTGWTRSP